MFDPGDETLLLDVTRQKFPSRTISRWKRKNTRRIDNALVKNENGRGKLEKELSEEIKKYQMTIPPCIYRRELE